MQLDTDLKDNLVFPKVRKGLEAAGWKDCFLTASFKKCGQKVLYSYISDCILDGKTTEQILEELT